MTTPLLQIKDLNVTYAVGDQEVPAVRGVGLTLDPGGTLGVAGESGSGKSTVAMSVLRLLPRTAKITGEILLDGEDVNAMKWGRLRAVRWAEASVVFQGAMHALNPVRRIGEQIAEPIRLHPPGGKPPTDAEVDARVAELLTQVDLPPGRAGAYPHELSGGQKQRVMIAMALACSPRLIIADEPTTALDVIVQAQVLDLLSRLVAEQDIGLIMISHDLSVLAATCARIAVMYDGRIVEEGPGAEVMAAPKHEHTRALAAAFPTVGDPVSRFAPRDQHPAATRARGTARRAASRCWPRRTCACPFRDRTGKRIDAVAGVDLTVSRDEIVALVGQSGSGKTTLARTLLGLQKPDSGVVRYAGKPVPAGGAGLKAYRRQVQLVLQDPTSALNPRPHGLRGRRRGTADPQAFPTSARSSTGRWKPRNCGRPRSTPTGSRTSSPAASASASSSPGPSPSNRRVVVADEPVASLDASVRGEILALLLRLRRELGLAALVITHDLGLAWNIADRVAVMYRGELVETGTVEQVLLDPQHEYTKSLLAALPGGTAQRRTVETRPET